MTNKKILIIEDDTTLLELLKERLEKKGYDVIFEKNGRNGLFTAKHEMPDLTLLDIMLPEMDGISVLKEIRKDDATKSLPVIVISNSGQPVEIEEIKSLKVFDYLIKTEFNPDELMQKINIFFNEKDQNKIKILIIEDDKFLKEILSKKFIKEGMNVIKAETAEVALEILKTEKPQIILLDLLLPGMHGFEFIKKLKKDSAISHIPIIVLSNFNEEKDIQTALSLGAKEFLVKAMSTPDEIVKKVKEIITKSYI